MGQPPKNSWIDIGPPASEDWTDIEDPTQQEEESIYGWLTRPRHHFFRNLADKFANYVTDPNQGLFGVHGDDPNKIDWLPSPTGLTPIPRDITSQILSRTRGFTAGAAQGIGDLGDFMTGSPGGIATTILSAGGGAAARAGLPVLAKTLGRANKIVNAPFVIHGAGTVRDAFTDTDKPFLPTLGEGLMEAGIGLGGMAHTPNVPLAEDIRLLKKTGKIKPADLKYDPALIHAEAQKIRNATTNTGVAINPAMQGIQGGALTPTHAPIELQLQNGMIPIPEGWGREVGKTTTKEGHTFRAEIDWNNKKIIFADEEAMNNPQVHNHEAAHIQFETMPDVARQKLMDAYLQQKQNEGDYAKYGVDWMVQNNHHREDIAIDLGNWHTNPELVDPKVRKLFDLWFKRPETKPVEISVAKPTVNDLIKEEGSNLPLNPDDIEGTIAAINEEKIRRGEPPLTPEEEAQLRAFTEEPTGLFDDEMIPDREPTYDELMNIERTNRNLGIIKPERTFTPVADAATADRMINQELEDIHAQSKDITTATRATDPEAQAWSEIFDKIHRAGMDPHDIRTPEDLRGVLELLDDPNMISHMAGKSKNGWSPIHWNNLKKVANDSAEEHYNYDKMLQDVRDYHKQITGAELTEKDLNDVMDEVTTEWNKKYAPSEHKIIEQTPLVDATEPALETTTPTQSFGKVGIEVGRDPNQLIKTIATSYSGADVQVAVKEMMQNHGDAATEVPNGRMSIHTDPDNGRITVSDNGKGLSLDLIKNEFTKVSESGKRGKGQTGEMGVGKVTYMTRGDRYDVVTVVQEPPTNPVRDALGKVIGEEPNPLAGRWMEYRFGGTPDDFFSGNINIEGRDVAPGSKTGTTSVFTVSPETKFQPLEDYLDSYRQHSTVRVPVDYDLAPGEWARTNPAYNDPKGIYMRRKQGTLVPRGIQNKLLTVGESPGMKYTITIPDHAITEETNRINVIINARGMFQGVHTIYFNEKFMGPSSVVAEIDPKVLPGHGDYPLTTPTREKFVYKGEEVIKKALQETIVDGSAKARKEELGRIFEQMKPQPGKKFVVVDSEGKLLPEEKEYFENHPSLNAISTVTDRVLDTVYQQFLHRVLGQIYSRGYLIASSDRGTNVRNPATNKHYAILLNPLNILKSAANPRQAANAFVHVTLHEFTHTMVREEGPKFTSAFADVDTVFDLQDQVNARNEILKIISQDGRSYNPEILELLQKGEDALGRTGTPRNALLTEESSRLPSGEGQGGVPFNTGRGGESAVAKLKQAIGDSYALTAEQRDIYRSERAQKFNKARRTRGGGEEWWNKFQSKMKGEHTRVEGTPLELEQSDVDSLYTMIKESTDDVPARLHAGTGLAKVLNGDVPQFNELRALEQVFGKSLTDFFAGYHGLAGPENLPKVDVKKPSLVTELVNLPRTLQASIDLSAPFRQGIGLIHTKAWWDSWPDMVRAFGSEKAYRGVIDDILSRENYQRKMGPTGRLEKSLAERAGLKLTDLTDVTKREESMMSTWAEKVPGVRPSNRAYTAFLDKLRADTFDSLIKDAERTGLDPRHNDVLLKQIAEYVNNATGRGSLGAKFERTAVGLNSLFFSPRLIASRVQMLNPRNYVMTNPFVRKQYAKSMIAMATSWMTIATLAKLAGANVSTDPTSSDFGKIRIGNTRLDPAGGFQQYLVLIARLASNKFTSATTGKSTTMGQKFGGQTREQILLDFFKNKLAPVPRTGLEFMGATRYAPFETGDTLLRLFMPMLIQDVSEILQEDPTLLPIAALGGIGMGVQEFDRGGGNNRFLPEGMFPRSSDLLFPSNARRR